ncbi:hypothetical protein CLV67_110109 [Actinoplanes italicus]|uniref:Uncharacterized protein n=1 Tax=Actinoplanes italicus TaxID=113567 RepID=A0A2T0K8H0_9ACTN|nr:hypothetical protein CLV67_110109 [Actinoplanes italicus]
MRVFRIAPLAVMAAFGVAFTSACGDEKTAADAFDVVNGRGWRRCTNT